MTIQILETNTERLTNYVNFPTLSKDVESICFKLIDVKRVLIIPIEETHVPIKDTLSNSVGYLFIDRGYYIESKLAQELIDTLMNKPLVVSSKFDPYYFLSSVEE